MIEEPVAFAVSNSHLQTRESLVNVKTDVIQVFAEPEHPGELIPVFARITFTSVLILTGAIKSCSEYFLVFSLILYIIIYLLLYLSACMIYHPRRV